MGTSTCPATHSTGGTDPWGLLAGPVQTIPVCSFCSGAGSVAVGQDPDGAELLQVCRRCGGSGAPADALGGAA